MDAILSIENSQIPFSNVFISFNGVNDIDYQKFLRAKSLNTFKNSYVTFQTKKDLDAIDHGIFFLNHLKNYLKDSSTVFLLAHDDRIIPPTTDRFISLLNQSDLKSTIFFPSYHCCMVKDYDDIVKIIEKDEFVSAEIFFYKSLQENIATNMSGMILPFHAYEFATKAMRSVNSRGARFEHTTCISPGIKHIYFHNKLSMLIGERENSEGKMLSYRDHRVAAFNYIWSFFKNGQLKTLTKAPTYLYYLAKNWAGYMLYK